MREPLFSELARLLRWIFKAWLRESVKDFRRDAIATSTRRKKQDGALEIRPAMTPAQLEAVGARLALGWKKKQAEARVVEVSTEHDTVANSIVVRALQRGSWKAEGL